MATGVFRIVTWRSLTSYHATKQVHLFIPTTSPSSPRGPNTTPPFPSSSWVPRQTGCVRAWATKGMSSIVLWRPYGVQSVESLDRSTHFAQLGCVQAANPDIRPSRYSKRYSCCPATASVVLLMMVRDWYSSIVFHGQWLLQSSRRQYHAFFPRRSCRKPIKSKVRGAMRNG